MAIRAKGTSKVDNSEEALDLLIHTAELSSKDITGSTNIMGAIFRFGAEIGGHPTLVYYQVVGRNPLIVRRITGFAGDHPEGDVPASLIDAMNGHAIRLLVNQIRIEYRDHPTVVRYWRERRERIRKAAELREQRRALANAN